MLALASIRAYGAQLAFREESYKRIDRYSRAGRSFYNMNRQAKSKSVVKNPPNPPRLPADGSACASTS
jgi:hypothetical protein